MVKDMGYYDKVLQHSSGPWKKHKYTEKIGEGAKAIYKYAKNANKNITGSAYKKEAKDERERAEYANELAGSATRNLRVGRNVDDVKKNGSADWKFASSQNWADSAAYHGRKAAEAQSNYYSKSLAGKAEKAAKRSGTKMKSVASDSIKRGQKIIDDLFKPKTKISVTSNLMPAGTKKVIRED